MRLANLALKMLPVIRFACQCTNGDQTIFLAMPYCIVVLRNPEEKYNALRTTRVDNVCRDIFWGNLWRDGDFGDDVLYLCGP